MSSSSKGPRYVPPPPGSKAASTYARFIPREELGDFAAWQPGSVFDGAAAGGSGAAAATPAAEPAAPTAADWQVRVDAARQAGYQDGYRDGLVALEGFKQSFASQATAQIGALLDSFDTELARLDQAIAAAVTRTAVQLARQVLRHELKGDPALVAHVAAEAVDAVLLSARHISVHVHPLDLPLVADGAAESLQARGARLLARPEIARGGVVVESDLGAIDARIATRWAQAAAALGTQEPWVADEGCGPSAGPPSATGRWPSAGTDSPQGLSVSGSSSPSRPTIPPGDQPAYPSAEGLT